MQVGILGPLVVTADGREVAVGGARVRALLVRLAADAGTIVTVDVLSDALWGDDGPADPTNALQSLVSRLRRALPASGLVRSAPGGYSLDIGPDAVDAHRFERLAREGARLVRSGDHHAALRIVNEGLGLWRGPALADVAAAGYARAVAARLEELRVVAMEDRVEAELATGDPGRLVGELRALVAEHPLRERLRAQLLRALYAAGRQADALAAYEELRRLLVEEVGVDPSQELQELHLAILRQDTSVLPARTRPRVGSNIPSPLSSFVGRHDEVEQLVGRLGTVRLVTLVGAGGAGKTRLATTVAARLADRVPGGVWLVELAPVADPADVAPAVIAALRVRDRGPMEDHGTSHDAATRLADAVGTSEALIVLDNCEHVVDAAAHLVEDVLGRCPRLRIVATSREPLGIVGETLHTVRPLGLPRPGASVDEALTSPAVRLFTDRAGAVRSEFALTDENVGDVVEICRRLDGLPLAIELAAARLRSLPVREVATRLGDRFRLFSGSRTAVPRHQTLRAAVAWSWDLLDDEERGVAERLAVFPGAVTPDSAARVCAGSASAPVLDLLAALVDKSLLQVVQGSEPRYRMLETIREYGLERLAEAGTIQETRAAHAAHYVDLAERAAPHLGGGGELPWIGLLSAENDNLFAALHHARELGDAATAVSIVAALGPFWTYRGDHATAASWIRLGLDLPGEAPPDLRVKAAALFLINTALAGTGASVDANGTAVRPDLGHAARAGPQPYAAIVAATLGLLANDVTAGLAALARSPAPTDPWERGLLHLVASFLRGNGGDMQGLHGELATASAAFREAGERWGLATSLTYLAYTDKSAGDIELAVQGLEEAIRLLRELDPDDPALMQRIWLAELHAHRGDPDRARQELLDMVAPGPAQIASAEHLAMAHVALGDLARHAGDLDEAAAQYDAAREHILTAPGAARFAHALVETAKGHLAVATGDPGSGRQHLAESLAVAVELPDMPLAAHAGIALARLLVRDADARAAAEVLGASHLLRGGTDVLDADAAGLVVDLRETLGERAYHAAYAAGHSGNRDDALALLTSRTQRG